MDIQSNPQQLREERDQIYAAIDALEKVIRMTAWHSSPTKARVANIRGCGLPNVLLVEIDPNPLEIIPPDKRRNEQ